MKRNTTKRALLLSALSLLLCVSMLVGTTFAWFTDEVTSAGNIIKSGNLDVTMSWADGKEDPAKANWKDASAGAIFNYDLWEPGYTEVRHVKIENVGTLALKYQISILANGQVSDLADVIDVYYVDPAVQVADREALVNAPKLGTLTEVLENLGKTGYGELEAGENHTITLALKMQETAGNEYKNKAIGTDFSVVLTATQLAFEADSFDNQYDKYSVTVSTVEELLDRLANAEPGEKIYMEPGEYVLNEALELPSDIGIYGAQAGKAAKNWANDPNAAKTVLKAPTGNVIEIIQTEEDPADATKNITIDGILIDCENKAAAGILVYKTDGEAIEGIRIANTAVINSTDDGIAAYNTFGAVIENNYVANVVDNAILLANYNGYHYETWEEVTAYVRNNVIENVTNSANGAIMLECGMGDVVVSGNVIRNVSALDPNPGWSDSVKCSAITVYDVYEGGAILIEKNTIENVDQGIAIYKYTYNTVTGESWWEGPTTADDNIVTVSENSISEFKFFGIKTRKLDEEGNAANTTLVEISDNALTSAITTNAIEIGTESGNYLVTRGGNTFNGAALD